MKQVRHKLVSSGTWIDITSPTTLPTYFAFGGMKTIRYANEVDETNTKDRAYRLVPLLAHESRRKMPERGQVKTAGWAVVSALLAIACADVAPPRVEAPGVEVIGHTDLGARGMNAQAAIAGRYFFVGSNTDTRAADERSGVLVVDIGDPANPEIVGEIGPPNEGLFGVSSRELRTVPEWNLLIVLNIICHGIVDACDRDLASFPETLGAAELANLKFYDIREPLGPILLSTYRFEREESVFLSQPHEFFLWRDPRQTDRALLFVTVPHVTSSLMVLDISDVNRGSSARLLTTYQPEDWSEPSLTDYLHSVSVSRDGRRTHAAAWGAGFFVLDSSELADDLPAPGIRPLTPALNRVDRSPPDPPAVHSAVEIPGREIVLVTDEVYPSPVGPGCPWGWVRLIDISDPARPVEVGEYRVAENDAAECKRDPERRTNFSAHNPTVTEHLALVSWHAAGLQILDTSDPALPTRLASFRPEPLSMVAMEDPVMPEAPSLIWSYPIVRDGLIYVVDARNGLYVLRYRGPYEEELEGEFIEGNSSL